jgi:hypothetical protein
MVPPGFTLPPLSLGLDLGTKGGNVNSVQNFGTGNAFNPFGTDWTTYATIAGVAVLGFVLWKKFK